MLDIRVRQRPLHASKVKLKSPFSMVPEHLTIHNTFNDATAEAEAKYMSDNNTATSFHYAVDHIEAVQIIPEDRNAFAAGDGAKGPGNRKSIHIEICFSKNGGPHYRQSEINGIKLAVSILKRRGWGMDRVKYHKDWSGKNCPHRILDEGRGDLFKKEIEDALLEACKPIVEIASVKEEGVRMFKPSTQTLINEMVSFLELAHKNGILTSAEWAKKAKEGTLTLDDAVALQATVFRRSIVEKK